MIVDRNNTDRSKAELVFPRAVCKLTFSVDPGEPGMATLRYYKNNCECCPRTSYLGSSDIRRLINVLSGESVDESFGFATDARDDYQIRFLYRDSRAHFHGCHNGEAKFCHETMSDFGRRLLIAAASEVLACERTTKRFLRRF